MATSCQTPGLRIAHIQALQRGSNQQRNIAVDNKADPDHVDHETGRGWHSWLARQPLPQLGAGNSSSWRPQIGETLQVGGAVGRRAVSE
jgi:hypothetical protein